MAPGMAFADSVATFMSSAGTTFFATCYCKVQARGYGVVITALILETRRDLLINEAMEPVHAGDLPAHQAVRIVTS